jgi:hypothetical protein
MFTLPVYTLTPSARRRLFNSEAAWGENEKAFHGAS